MESKREVWAGRVAGWRRSGLTAKQYARSIGVNWGTLAHWAWRLGRDERDQASKGRRGLAKTAPATMIEVVGRSEASDDGFELRLASGRRLQIPAQFDAAALQRLLDVLEGRL
jgi:transposase